MLALRSFVMRHEVFVEASEFEDHLFRRRPTERTKALGPRRHFRVSLRRKARRVHMYTVSCGSDDLAQSAVSIDFPEKVLLRAAEAAVEYDACGRDVRRYTAQLSRVDMDPGHAIFGYLRSESRLLQRLLGPAPYAALVRLVKRHSRRRTQRAGRLRRSASAPRRLSVRKGSRG
jgi:hypothetical protein